MIISLERLRLIKVLKPIKGYMLLMLPDVKQ